jgi:hypothetical protein
VPDLLQKARALTNLSGADPSEAPSKKNATGASKTWEICCSRRAPIRLVPFSHFFALAEM